MLSTRKQSVAALSHSRAEDGDGEQRLRREAYHSEGEFRRYLECGIPTHGFARARCGECKHDFLIAFSCRGRAVCPSCNAGCMAEQRRI